MAKTVTTPITLRVPMDVFESLQRLATLRGVSPSAAAREVLHRAMIEGRLQSYVDPAATSAAPAAPTKPAPVLDMSPEAVALRAKLDALFDGADEPAAPAPAHTASTPAPASPPANPRDWLLLDGSEPDPDTLEQLVFCFDTPEKFAAHNARERKRLEQERIKATILTPEQTMARIAEGMAAVRAQPGHGYIEPYVRVDHAPKREPLTAANSAELPEAGTPAWIAMAERQGLPPEAIAEVVAATQPSPAPEAKVVSGSFDFDAWGD